jgi:mono/diheme cytochrome c family protein
MKRTRLLSFLIATLLTNTVCAAPLEKGDPKTGEKLAKKSCEACHVSLFGGDGSKVYTRSDRIVKNAEQLRARVATCNTNSGAGLFPEEEEHIAAYLNQQFYKFK